MSAPYPLIPAKDSNAPLSPPAPPQSVTSDPETSSHVTPSKLSLPKAATSSNIIMDGDSETTRVSPTSARARPSGGANRPVTDTEEGDDGDVDSIASADPATTTAVDLPVTSLSEFPPTVEDDGCEEDDGDDMSDYSYEDEDDALAGGFLTASGEALAAPEDESTAFAVVPPAEEEAAVPPLSSSGGASALSGDAIPSQGSSTASRVGGSSSGGPSSAAVASRKRPWQEPSRAAVTMSLRAERERTGGRRRLASDLYQILSGSTKEQGFSMEPSCEDSLSKWKIKLFGFDEDSELHRDMRAVDVDHIELEMSFPDQYPFEPPFVRVVRPRFVRQTGFVMDGALCMELLTPEGWNPVNDIESVIVSIRSLLVVGDGRLAAALPLHEKVARRAGRRGGQAVDGGVEGDGAAGAPAAAKGEEASAGAAVAPQRDGEDSDVKGDALKVGSRAGAVAPAARKPSLSAIGGYSSAEARAAYSHLSDYHKKKGWDMSGWWAKKG
eukprot:CAMPEP_0194281988 /NCGR_PEP_ID=MMETSP0169-20130528/22103_1 /TAXON_ID=218684 /ORGANISM="Corethron pennatum, Strain L29A3" /LENGTH=496 /DNA_ID=CAMNT_0039027191 /DNA_START=167 /DNA_END=1657 /DNA_ORIENTATION=+